LKPNQAVDNGRPYSEVDSPEKLGEVYAGLLQIIHDFPLFAGFCYTQFADTYQETNGLLSADRTPKFPLVDISTATRGPKTDRVPHLEWDWRERLMNNMQGQYVVPKRGLSSSRIIIGDLSA
jgi:hypothetical protein